MFFKENEYLSLKQFLVERYEQRYSYNDKAHRIDHVVGVCNLALKLNEQLELGIDRRLIVIPAICHDLFTWSRSNHHELGRLWLLTANEGWLEQYTADERHLMANAIAEHRASYKGEYGSTLSELIASADRGAPVSVADTVARAHQYGMCKLGLDEETSKVRAVEHVKEKFGKGGYAKYPNLYMRAFGDQLQQFQADIAAL